MNVNKSVKNTSDTTKSFVDTKTLLIVPLIKETLARKSLGDSLLRVAQVETLARKSLGDSLLRVAQVETLARKSLGDSLLRVAQVETLARKSLGDSLLRVAQVETLARIVKVRGQNGIYVPVLCGSLVLSDREYA